MRRWGRRGWSPTVVVVALVSATVVVASPRPAAATARTGAMTESTAKRKAPSPTSTSQLPAHAASEGYVLGTSPAPDHASTRARCPAKAPVRSYDVAAIAVDITLNRF